jgi:hypothetical protein
MASEPSPIDISAIPELARLADEVARTRRPRLLRRGNEAIAVLAPTPVRPPRPRPASSARDSRGIAERTAGALRRYARQPPATRAEEKDAFARAVAEEVARDSGA